jgi:hypothetical protein
LRFFLPNFVKLNLNVDILQLINLIKIYFNKNIILDIFNKFYILKLIKIN